MNGRGKITTVTSAPSYCLLRHRVRAQVEHNRESTERQYALAKKLRLGWR